MIFAYQFTIGVPDLTYPTSNVRWPSKLKIIIGRIESGEKHLKIWCTYILWLQFLVNILALYEKSLKMSRNCCNSFGSHDHVEANTKKSIDSLSSFFEDSSTLDDDFVDWNSRFHYDCCEQVLETEIKDIKIEKRKSKCTMLSIARHLHIFHCYCGYRWHFSFTGF